MSTSFTRLTPELTLIEVNILLMIRANRRAVYTDSATECIGLSDDQRDLYVEAQASRLNISIAEAGILVDLAVNNVVERLQASQS